MKFAISAWRAVSPFHQTLADWRQWVAQGRDINGLTARDIDVSFLPAMKRRRLSSAARLMFAASWPLLPENISCPVVFVSHDGEINRSFQLWQSLLQQEELSPTSFALSVHNAIVGQWSLMRADMSECIALSARYNGLEMGITEAVGLLEEGASQVLVVVVEEPIAAEYNVAAVRAPFPLALGLILTTGEQTSLTYSPMMAEATDNPLAGTLNYYSSTLDWIVQQVTAQTVRRQPAEQGVWQWRIG
ncbi:beta-ketoacyl synthase chain length factor [Snodgrassella sp. ESL0253]|uniref:beta-ketoacyl synthase chain length factor n=1 Tax=Snodgrassella sp. ESL0253 TaxID=2705031 RepID=UPI001582CDB3|nr:beta-ketoacyl synthase chain length factor [Snodgrassella sp. ESL0253]NUE67441.1 beta-ketoacyl synthase chain length factor [Snodgrassella sp. ESL0253]